MEMRSYKNTDEKVSLLGFGLMRLPKPDPDKPDIDYKAAEELVDWAMANGITYYDTAYVYHGKQSEDFAAHALGKYPRDSYKLATKLPTWLVESEADVEKFFNEQLEKCKVDYFDYYLIHSLSASSWPAVKKYNIYEQLKEKQRQGKIRHLGFSFHDAPPLLQEMVDAYEWDFAQIQLNYLDWEQQDAKTLYEILNKKGIPVVIMEPVRGGSLVTLCDKSVEIFQKADPKVSTASWAIRYAASLPGVLTVLSGMSTLDQVKDNVGTMTGFKPLTEAEYAVVDEAVKAYRSTGAIPCTGCRYCMDCPAGVDIPRVFSVYNSYKVRESKEGFLGEYSLMGEPKQAAACVKCNQCVGLCPQQLAIPDLMEEIAATAKTLLAEVKED